MWWAVRLTETTISSKYAVSDIATTTVTSEATIRVHTLFKHAYAVVCHHLTLIDIWNNDRNNTQDLSTDIVAEHAVHPLERKNCARLLFVRCVISNEQAMVTMHWKSKRGIVSTLNLNPLPHREENTSKDLTVLCRKIDYLPK